MTDDTMPLLDALLKCGGGDFMKESAEDVLQRLMAYDIEGRIGAGRYERNDWLFHSVVLPASPARRARGTVISVGPKVPVNDRFRWP